MVDRTLNPVLIVSRCPPYPQHLGDRLIVWHLARHLAAQGYPLDLLAFAQLDSDWHEQTHYAPFFRHITLIPEPNRTPASYLWRTLNPRSRFAHTAKQSWSPAMWQTIQAQLAANTYQAVHLFGSVQVYEFAPLLAKQHTVITPYESYSLFLARQIAHTHNPADRVRRWLAQQFETWMFNPYQAVTVLAQPDADELAHLNPRLPLHIIPNGVDTEYFNPQANFERLTLPSGPSLLFVGNYEYAPNVSAARWLVERVLPVVQAQHADAQAWIVGNNPPPELRALAGERVLVTGRVADVRPYYAQATVFVCPLVVGAGIKNKVLEALAMGLPVVSTPLGVDGIHVQHGQSALIADLDAIPAIVNALLSDVDLQHRLTLAGRQVIESAYAWPSVVKRYAALYEPPHTKG